MVKLRIGLWKLHLQRFKSPEGEALYRYDAFTLSHALDWCCTYTDHEETLPLYRESLIFNLLTDEWFGLKHPIANWTVETAWKKLTTREEGYFIKEHGVTEDEVAGLLALIERI